MAAVFTPGKIVIQPQAELSMRMQDSNPASLLLRHVSGDWGDVREDQKQTNDEAVREGGRILSIYGHGRRRLYVMTQADRSTTSILTLQED